MFGFLKKKKTLSGKPRAIAFVDYEHWFISLDKMYHTRPDIKAWRNELSQSFEMQEIIFFADFSNPSLRTEIPRIREVSNYIIETQNTAPNHKKDFTDFIMLDHIYQKAFNSPDISVFLLFSGDGHFNSVTNYLISQLRKTVGVYAVRGAMSTQLRNTASWVELVPKIEDPHLAVYRMILKNLKNLQANAEASGKKLYPSFWATVESVARLNGLRRKDVAEALRSLLEKGYASQNEVTLSEGKKIQTLVVDWKKCKNDGIWNG